MDRLLLFQSLKQMSFRQFHQLSGAGLIVDSVMGFTVSRGRPPPTPPHHQDQNIRGNKAYKPNMGEEGRAGL